MIYFSNSLTQYINISSSGALEVKTRPPFISKFSTGILRSPHLAISQCREHRASTWLGRFGLDQTLVFDQYLKNMIRKKCGQVVQSDFRPSRTFYVKCPGKCSPSINQEPGTFRGKPLRMQRLEFCATVALSFRFYDRLVALQPDRPLHDPTRKLYK
jgi:hypothetical protein